MPTEVELPDGSIAEFPDEMDQDAIHGAVNQHLYGETDKQRSAAAMAEKRNPRAQMMTGEGEMIPAPENQPGIVRSTLKNIVTQAAPGTTLEEAVNKPLTQLLPEGTYKKAKDLATTLALQPLSGLPEGKVKGAISGAVEGAGDLAESFTSPLGIATLVARAPAGLQRLISAAFAAQSGKDAATDMQPLADAIQNGDWETASRLAVGKLGGAAIAATAGTHALAPETMAVPPRIRTEAAKEIPLEVLPPEVTQAEKVLPRAAAEAKQAIETANVEPPTAAIEEPPSKPPVAEVPPAAVPKPAEAGLPEDVAKIEGMDAKTFAEDMKQRGSLTIGAWKLGQSASDAAHLEAIQTAMERSKAKGKAAMAAGDFNTASTELNKGQFFREAYEAATGTGSAGKALRERDPNYQPPFPEGKPKVEAPKEVISDGSQKEKKENNEGLLKQPAGGELLPAEPKTPKRGGGSKQERPPDILDTIEENYGSIKLSKAAKGGTEDYYTDAYKTARKLRPKLFSETGQTPDVLVDQLRRDGYVGEDFTVDDLWDAMIKAHGRRGSFFRGETPEAQAEKFNQALAKQQGQRKAYNISVGDLQVGDEFAIDGEKFKILHIDPENGEVTAQDGKKFGAQVIPDGADIPIDKGSHKKAKVDKGQSFEESAAEVEPVKPATPKLRPGEKAGELLQGQDQPFNLSGETGTDAERAQQERAAAAKSKAEDQKLAAKQQQTMPLGPGAATRPGAVLQTDIGQFESNIPPLEQLADAVKRFPKQPGGGFQEKLKQWMDDVGIPMKDFATRALVGAKAATARVIDAFTNLPKVTSMDRAVGQWNLEDTEGDLAARRFADAVKQTFPDRSKLRALSNWINAGGDKELLERQAQLTTDPELKKTYTDALKFGKDEARLADEIKHYHDQMLAQAMEAGALEEGVEDYLHRYYPKESDPTRKRIESALNEYRFTKNFAGFKRRFYDSDFEAEQAGLKPEKDAAKRILAYDQGFRKALTARAFVKDRYSATMPDKRPEIDVVGVGVPSKMNAETGKESPYLIKPKTKASGDAPEDYRGDYVTFDHPAFRRWKWVGEDENGKPILMEGEMAVHPDAVKKYRALFERSWFQKNPLGKALLVPSHFVKQTMLALSAFHPVQIGIHAIEHKTNPFNLVDLNTRDPRQAELIKGGLVVSDLGGGNHFSEGVAGSGLFGKLPIAGEMIKGGQDWLFKDFIPRIKMTMGIDALERNRKTYAKDVAAGKITDEQLVRLTARESNAAFGEQNYRAMFRHKGFQDLLRFAFLAPDFGEARLRFPAQALTKYGGEQRMALFLGALGMFVAAKTAEKMLTGKTQMDWKHLFTVNYNGKEYGLRNVASDLVHMISDPAGYLRNRLNPIYTRPMLEMLSGRDAFGRKRTAGQQALDEAKQIIPISGRGMVEKDQKLWESFVNAVGLTERRRSSFGDEMKAVNEWKDKKGYVQPGEFVYDQDKDPYAGLTRQLTFGDVAEARKALDKLTAGKTPAEARKIADHYRRSLVQNKFLTGSRAHEAEYLKGLSASDRQRYDDAKAERKAMWDKFVKAWRSKYPPTQ